MSIKQVTKRVGEMEAYDPNKILKWLFWGSKSLETIIDWQKIMLKVDSELFEGIGTQQIQLKAIDICLSQQDTRYNLLAGRLYTAFLRKKLYDNEMPSVKDQCRQCVELGFMEELGYSDEEFEVIEKLIDHSRDFELVHSQVSQLYNKYALFNQDTNERYETPQYTCMRMAMALSVNEKDRLTAVRENYDMFSLSKGNAPTPNYLNLGTPHRGLLSCCLYEAGDDVKSIDAGDHIAYTMTYMSAGIGGVLSVRSLDDPVKKGKIKHKGKLPYFRRQAASVMANSQGGRGGSCTSYFMCFDPEVMTLIHLQNPRTPKLKQIRDIHFAIQFNAFFYEKMKNKEDVFLFNVYTAPDLHAAFYDPDSVRFTELYNKYENDSSFKKTYLNAAVIAVAAGRQFHEVSTLYSTNITAINHHTPFKEPIKTSNLCVEIHQVVKAYSHITQLYDPEDTPDKGEISLCGLGAMVPSKIIHVFGEDKFVRTSLDFTLASDIEYEQIAYRQLRMIDQCLHLNHYVFPHLKTTALNRMNAGVGLMGIAYDMAKRNFRYDSEEGLKYIHFLAERHMFILIKAALRLGKEHGNAPWIHKTKWPDGWLPIDTYNRNVDKITDFKLYFPWEELRAEVIKQGGLRFSCLVAHMPQESSSKVSNLPNSYYPIRDLKLMKSDESNIIEFIAPEAETLGPRYQLAWEPDTKSTIQVIAVLQKFCDSGISADRWNDRTDNAPLKASKLLDEIYYDHLYGVKGRYYTVSKTTEGKNISSTSSVSVTTPQLEVEDDIGYASSSGHSLEEACPGGFCSL